MKSYTKPRMNINYLCVDEEELNQVKERLKQENKKFKVYCNNEKMMFVLRDQVGKRVKFIVKEL